MTATRRAARWQGDRYHRSRLARQGHRNGRAASILADALDALLRAPAATRQTVLPPDSPPPEDEVVQILATG